MTETFRPALAFCRPLIALKRRSTEPVSAIAAPSMSKSRWSTWYLLMTLWYAACNDDWLVQDWPNSAPPAPPNEMIVLAPAACARAIRAFTVEFSMPSVSPQIGVQPEPMTNAAV